jgi:hypothetical protein
MRANDGLDVSLLAAGVSRAAPEALLVAGVGRPGVNYDKTGQWFTHEVTVGARTRHQPGVGCGHAVQVAQQRNRLRRPVSRGQHLRGVGVQELTRSNHYRHFDLKISHVALSPAGLG